MRGSEIVSVSERAGGGSGSPPDHPRKAPGKPPALGRLYPRHVGEAPAVPAQVRAAGALSGIGYLYGSLHDVEAAIVADLGGAEALTTAQRETLALALHAEAMCLALIGEVAANARESRDGGHVPHISRYKATQVLGYWIDLAARLLRHVGVERRARPVGSYVEEALARQAGRGRAISRRGGPVAVPAAAARTVGAPGPRGGLP